MDSLRDSYIENASIKIKFLIKELLTHKGSNKKIINNCLSKLNDMDHKILFDSDHDVSTSY